MPHRRVVSFIRGHIFSTIVVLMAVFAVTSAYATLRSFQLANQIVDARQHDCQNGNVVRGHIQFVTSALHDLLALSLAAPPPPNQTQGQKLLRQNFQQITDRLGERLAALAPRDCSRSGVTDADGTPVAP